ncbi:MAG: ferrous iron transporter B [Coriobacteriales bacterium]|jgi:ferrous iron transport protein B|nr:ferrous iron transporter B [Coriobacteriales bacterium]
MAESTTTTIALAGNPNSGKTTMFNALTGASQHVGNWPGVTVERKEGRFRDRKDVLIQDLPGIYSLAPYSPEEVISRSYLIRESPSAIINIVDASNLERNLYLTTQLTELGIPVVLALNMMDIVQKRGDVIDIDRLSERLGVAVVETSALKGIGCKNVVEKALWLAEEHRRQHRTTKAAVAHEHPHSIFVPRHRFSATVEDALKEIGEIIAPVVTDANVRWYAIKFFERDAEVSGRFTLSEGKKTTIEQIIAAVEKELDDDSESIIANERYTFIGEVISETVTFKSEGKLTISDKIDRVVTNRILALPIFALIMFLVYYIAVSSLGTIGTDWANDGVFGDGWHLLGIGQGEYETAVEEFEAATEEGIEAEEPDPASFGIWVPGAAALGPVLESLGTATWLSSLLLDGIIAGVGAVLGFLPQMLLLFLLLAVLEDCGYMARIAFILDRLFKRFGLSGKSFIPILIGTGCGVPGILASRTIENESNRRLTVMTTTFIPCGAKLPIIALIVGALFPGNVWIGPSTYFIGIAAIICSGIILKKTRLFTGDPSPFLIELPSYHTPRPGGVLRVMWERGFAFIKRAGTIILIATILVWFLSSFNWAMQMVEDASDSMLAGIGGVIAPIFDPLGWGDWRATTATFTGLIAKENVVGTFGVLYGVGEVGEDGAEYWGLLAASFTQISAFSFLLFNLLCAPCFAAIGAIHREMASAKWTLIAVAYECVFAYLVAFTFFQIALLVTGAGFTIATAIAILVILAFIFLLFRRPYRGGKKDTPALDNSPASA